MTDPTTDDDPRLENIREYFRRVDAGDPALLSLFTEDAQVFFPKFGLARGRDGVASLATVLAAYVGELHHDLDTLRFVCGSGAVAVEGTERGTMHDGRPWPDGDVSQGLFCNVFEFSGALISRLHVYADPDFASSDTERIGALRRRP